MAWEEESFHSPTVGLTWSWSFAFFCFLLVHKTTLPGFSVLTRGFERPSSSSALNTLFAEMPSQTSSPTLRRISSNRLSPLPVRRCPRVGLRHPATWGCWSLEIGVGGGRAAGTVVATVKWMYIIHLCITRWSC